MEMNDMMEVCAQSEGDLPENVTIEISEARSARNGEEEILKKGIKREHSAIARTADVDGNPCAAVCEEIVERVSVDSETERIPDESSASEDAGSERPPPRKLSRLAEDVRDKLAIVPSNQAIVNAFSEYGDQQLHRGHTGQGVSHLRAARSIRDYPSAITSGVEARNVPLVGAKLASEVEQILSSSKLEDDQAHSTETKNVNADQYTPSRLVCELRTTSATRRENQSVVDELTKYGEHELCLSSGSEATPEQQLTGCIVSSGDDACHEVAHVGSVTTDGIDETSLSAEALRTVKDEDEKSAQSPENQHNVDESVDDRHLRSSRWRRGVTYLRAAKAVRDSETIVTSGKQVVESMEAIDNQVVDEIDHALKRIRDTAEDTENNKSSEHEAPDSSGIQEDCDKLDQVFGNQESNDSLSAHGEVEDVEFSDEESALTRAAHRLQDAAELVTSGSVVKTLGCIGEKVATFVSTTVGLKSEDDSALDDGAFIY